MTGLEVPTDGIVFTSILSHQSTGRIFLIGSTDAQAGQTVGNELFEFEYRSEEGWFKKRCVLVNHSKAGAGAGALSSLLPTWLKSVTQGNILMINIDQERNLIYLLLKSGSISILSLGRSGLENPTQVASASNIVREALAMCPAAGPLLDPRTFEITGIHIITKQEGGHVGLVAVTSQGVRMYFSLAKRPYGYGYSANSSTLPLSSDPDAIPSSLWLCHLRLPPRNSSPSTNQSKENQLSAINLSSGFQLMGDHQIGGMQDGEEAELEIPLIPNPLSLSYSHYTSPGGFWVSSHSLDAEHNILLAVAPDVAHLLQASSTSPATTATQAATSTGFLQTSNPSLSAQQQPFQSSISEIACPIKIEGHAWAITHTTQDSDLENYHPIQLVGPQQEWLVLSNMGITVLSSQRPVDTLAELLNNMPGKEQELSLFWDRYVSS
jgi:nuclear pore complex protein Nup155